MTDKHLSTKNRPENAALRRRFAAEEWAMPEDGPPMESHSRQSFWSLNLLTKARDEKGSRRIDKSQYHRVWFTDCQSCTFQN